MRIINRDRNDSEWNQVDRKHYPLNILERGVTPQAGDIVTVGEAWNSDANMQRSQAWLPDGLTIKRNEFDSALGMIQ
mgnify:CR=1 FL=1